MAPVEGFGSFIQTNEGYILRLLFEMFMIFLCSLLFSLYQLSLDDVDEYRYYYETCEEALSKSFESP